MAPYRNSKHMIKERKEPLPAQLLPIDLLPLATMYRDVDPVYLRKLQMVARAIDQIGWGRYHWGLFVVTGFSWFSDNAWPIMTALIMPRFTEINGVHPTKLRKIPYIGVGMSSGLLVGAACWSLSLDIIGRKWAHKFTFLFTGVFTVAAGSLRNYVEIASFSACWLLGVGGNIPVDSTILIESLPTNKRWVMAIMALWWLFGQVLSNILAWALAPHFVCDQDNCLREDNMGWRYFLYTMGGIALVMWIVRLLFPLLESPTFYIARGQDHRAIAVLDEMAAINGSSHDLTVEELQRVTLKTCDLPAENSTNSLLVARFRKYNCNHIRACFALPQLTLLTCLVLLVWSMVGMGFTLTNPPIPYYLQNKSSKPPLTLTKTYVYSLYVALGGIAGAPTGGLLARFRWGHKGVLVGLLLALGVFQYCSTTASSHEIYLGWSVLFTFFVTMMFGALFAYTPEVFYSKIRGTGVGLALIFFRIMGVILPVVAIYADFETWRPVYICGAMFLGAGVLVLLFPFQPHNQHAI